MSNNGYLTINGVVSGNNILSFAGSGTTDLTNTNTYNGSIIINSGTLKLSGNSTLGSGSYFGQLLVNGTLDYSSSVDQVLNGNVMSRASTSSAKNPYNANCKIIKNGSGTLHFRNSYATNSFDGELVINSGFIRVGNNDTIANNIGNGTGSIHMTKKITIGSGGTLEFNRSNSAAGANINAEITGSGAINVYRGSYTAGGRTGDYSGTITIDSGAKWTQTIILPNAVFLNNGTLVVSSNDSASWEPNQLLFTVTFGGGTTTYAYLADWAAGTAAAGDVMGQIQSAGLGNSMNEFAGFVPGRIAMVQRGAQTFQTKVNNAAAAGATGVIIYNNTTGITTPTVTSSIPVIMVTQSLGQQILTNLGSGTVSTRIKNAATGLVGFNNTVTGAGTFFKAGAVTLVLSGTGNTYTGGTVINGGTLRAGNATCFGTGTIAINAGATLDRAGFTITNSIFNNGGTIIN